MESLNIIVWGCRSWRKEKFEHSIIVSNGRINKFSCRSRSRQQINFSPSTKFFNLPRTSNRFNAMRGTLQELIVYLALGVKNKLLWSLSSESARFPHGITRCRCHRLAPRQDVNRKKTRWWWRDMCNKLSRDHGWRALVCFSSPLPTSSLMFTAIFK